MTGQPLTSGNAEAVVIVKAAPQVGRRHGETVCCAGIDIYGNWLRLYPVSFRTLEHSKKFGRWDRIKFKWRLPNDDQRIESRRVDQQSLEIVGELKSSERERFLANTIVTSLTRERAAGKSFALLKAEILGFKIEKKKDDEVKAEKQVFESIRSQADLFAQQVTNNYNPCPYVFKYKYRTDDGQREGTCQDWEIEATYHKWSGLYGEDKALAEMDRVFGKDYPAKGMLLAMGTHSLHQDTWLINGVVRQNDIQQGALI
ncbi:MAG: hypothetical protein Q8M24_18615 [Pseudolabrys sp.]|nr:hypothetical protein [Pseudolabrys sp.]MDP2297460.1 hypothetical protein [Pseudolabrys sp.]